MTGTYVLQSNRAKFNQYSVDPACLLCGDDAEDMIHFLLKCRCLSEPRDHRAVVGFLKVARPLNAVDIHRVSKAEAGKSARGGTSPSG